MSLPSPLCKVSINIIAILGKNSELQFGQPGFGARETERFLATINNEFKTNVKFMIVNELAAVYGPLWSM